MTEDQLLSETPPPASSSRGSWWGHEAKVFGSGLVSGVLSLPDLAVKAINAAPASVPSMENPALSDDEAAQPPAATPIRPPADFLGISPYLTQPQGMGEKLLYGAGAGLGGALTTGGLPVTSGTGFLRGLLPAATSGMAGTAAADLTMRATDNPYLAGAAALVAGGATGTGVSAAQKSANQILRPFTNAGRQTIAGQALAQGGAGGDLDAGIAAIGTAGNENAQQAASVAGAARLGDLAQNQKDNASSLFKQVPLKQTMVPSQPLLDNFNNHIGGLEDADVDLIPSTYEDLLKGYVDKGDTVSLSQLQSFSRRLNSEASTASRGGNDYKSKLLQDLHDAVFDGGGPEDLVPSGPAGSDLANAKQAWADYSQTYKRAPRNSPQQGVNTINRVVTGKVAPSAAFDTIFSDRGGQPERVDAFVNAAQGDPQLIQNARDYIAGQARDVATNPRTGQLDRGRLVSYLDDNPSIFQSGLFSDAERDAINGMRNEPGQMYQQLGTPGQQFQGLGMGRLARTLATGVPPTAAGLGAGALAYKLGVPEEWLWLAAAPTGLGAHVGGTMAHLGQRLYASPIARTRGLIEQPETAFPGGVPMPPAPSPLSVRLGMSPPPPTPAEAARAALINRAAARQPVSFGSALTNALVPQAQWVGPGGPAAAGASVPLGFR